LFLSRPTVAIINLGAIKTNLALLSDIAKGSKIVAVVKADAYGNGAHRVACAIEQYVNILSVAFLAEAQELRNAGITKPILILQGPHQKMDLQQGKGKNFIWMLHSEWQLQAFTEFAESSSEQAEKSWLKFDTGMHRLGLPLVELENILQNYASIIDDNTVLVTHLANADEPIQSRAKAQIETFIRHAASTNLPLCIANSASSIRFEQARVDYVRLGIALYGSTPFQQTDNPISLVPVMSLESQVIALRKIAKGDTVGYGSTWKAARESTIATVAIGYADGYPRHAPTSTPAWCNNQLISLVGRVSMDMLTFDVSDLPVVEIGDRVQLWGDKLPINDVAEHIGTIGYELMTRVSSRVPRKYIEN
jgi:alanine racemase